ncbi:MAG TPA: multicopper oxidase family protein [Ktedonobacteraceae bacterium]|nr:multicopper oxidase family protein [Ktedonobacteraceae bacterium]
MRALDRPNIQQPAHIDVNGTKKKPRKKHRALKGILFVLLLAGVIIGVNLWTSRWPNTINMSSTCGNMGSMHEMKMDGMDMTGSGSMCNTLPHSGGTPMAQLVGPQTAAHVDTFTLTAATARLSIGQGKTIDALTFNGTSPGPTLRVQQGDLVVVHLINKSVAQGVTIHWHGIDVPNAEDGVAGVTQNAVWPGQSYTYRFLAQDPGTYWYHSHQYSYDETGSGLYGAFIVDPTTPSFHDDVDATIQLHDWVSGSFPSFQINQLINGSTETLHIPAKPGQWVRLRLINTGPGALHVVTVAGAPFTVVALDGHNLNGPTPLVTTPLPIGSAQRYDVRFQMPASGAVALFREKDTQDGPSGPYNKTPVVTIGQGSTPAAPAIESWFDYTHYGTPDAQALSVHSHFDATYTLTLSSHVGFYNGKFGAVYMFNGQAFPNTPTIVVQFGQVIRLHFVNTSKEVHPIHLHGHMFTVLERNGHPLIGSPVRLDTINILPGETDDIAFVANNPGLWMLHCHNLAHANLGMDMMIAYANISTPYSIGNTSKNFPD